MTQPMLAKVTALRDDLAANLLERETAIEAALLALLTGEHLLLLGPPGTAKSLLVRSLCHRIDGANYFERLLTRFSTPEEIFGPLSLSALEQDRYQRVTKGSLVEAHIAFLDEIYKANSAILNSLLAIINERVYHEAGQAMPVPLRSLFGASNETLEDNGLAALHDRFLLRVVVPPLADDASMRSLLVHEPAPPGATITLDELRAAQGEVQQVALTDEAREAIITIKHELETEGVAASDRRWKACARLVRGKAWLEGEGLPTSLPGAELSTAKEALERSLHMSRVAAATVLCLGEQPLHVLGDDLVQRAALRPALLVIDLLDVIGRARRLHAVAVLHEADHLLGAVFRRTCVASYGRSCGCRSGRCAIRTAASSTGRGRRDERDLAV